MKLKKLAGLGLAAVLAASAILTGCGNSKDKEQEKDGKVVIQFLNGFTGGDGEYMRKITNGFNKSQDKYKIVESQEKDHYTKFKSGDYDMVVIHGDRLKTYADDGMIQDVSDLYDKTGISINDFVEAAQKMVSIDNGLYAFPLDIHPLVMFYNKELVKEAPKNYEDIKNLQAQLSGQGKDLYAMGIPGLGLVEFYYMSLATQNGLNLEKDGYLNFATDEFADVLKKFNDMIFKDGVSPAKLGIDGDFKSFMQDSAGEASAQTAIDLTGPWCYNAAKEKYGDNLGIAPIPVIGKSKGVYGNAHTIAVSSSVKDKKVMDGIGAFFKYLYQPKVLVNWADAGQAPTHKATIEYITAHKDEYPLPYVDIQQFDNCKIAPQIYNVGEQTKYVNETVFNLIVSKEMSKDEIMKELVKATKIAKQVSEDK